MCVCVCLSIRPSVPPALSSTGQPGSWALPCSQGHLHCRWGLLPSRVCWSSGTDRAAAAAVRGVRLVTRVCLMESAGFVLRRLAPATGRATMATLLLLAH